MNPTENKQTKTKLKVGIFAGIIIFIGAVIVLLKGASSGTQDMISNTNNSSAGQNSQTAQTNNTASTVVVYKDAMFVTARTVNGKIILACGNRFYVMTYIGPSKGDFNFKIPVDYVQQITSLMNKKGPESGGVQFSVDQNPETVLPK
jgi:hypothetical protein